MAVNTYSFHIGDIEAAVIADDVEVMSEETFNGIFNSDAAATIRAAFQQLAEPPRFGRNILYVKTPTQRILVDTGLGVHPPQVHGSLEEGLRSLGVSPDEITLLIITHFHLDHVWGMLNADGGLTYPNARVVVPQNEWDHWMRDEFLATLDELRRTVLGQVFKPYIDAGRLDKITDDGEIVPGIRYVPMAGHTPGHSGLSITSSDVRLLHIADTAHVPIQLEFMDAPPRFDALPNVAVETRRRVFARAFESREIVMAYHFGFPGLGHVIQPEGDFYWQPLDQGNA